MQGRKDLTVLPYTQRTKKSPNGSLDSGFGRTVGVWPSTVGHIGMSCAGRLVQDSKMAVYSGIVAVHGGTPRICTRSPDGSRDGKNSGTHGTCPGSPEGGVPGLIDGCDSDLTFAIQYI